jgi:hypothetical protein
MRIGQIIIDGQNRVADTLLREFEITKESGDRMGMARMIVLYDPDDAQSFISAGDSIDIYRAEDDESSTAETLFGSTSAIFGEPLFGEATPAAKIFAGTVTNVRPMILTARREVGAGGLAKWGEPEFGSPLWGETEGYERINCVQIECRDQNYYLESATVSGAFTSQTDKAIITSLFAAAPGVDITDVASTATVASIEFAGDTLRSALSKIAERTGAVFYIDADMRFHYFLPAAKLAAFALSENPDFSSSFPFERQTFEASEEWRSPANHVTVLGRVGTGGTRITSTRSDATSIAQYGERRITLMEPTIATTAEAQARADVELAKRAYPQIGGTLVTYVDGLEVGDFLTIDASSSLNISGQFTIRRISMRWLNKTTPRYHIEWGAYQPDVARTLSILYNLTIPPGSVLPSVPAPDTVGPEHIIPGSIEYLHLAELSVGFANIQDLAVGEAQIQDGAITNAKVGDAQIDDAKIINLSAGKINTGDLNVGGSGFVGQITVRDSANGAFGWVGKNGSDYGAWFETLWIGGSGPSSAKLRAVDGNVSLVLDDNDSFTLTSSSGGRKIIMTAGAVTVEQTGASGNSTQIVQSQVTCQDTGGGIVSLLAAGSGSGVFVNSSKIIGTRKTGWNAWTGTADRASANTESTSLTQVARTMKALLDDLISHGVIGA